MNPIRGIRINSCIRIIIMKRIIRDVVIVTLLLGLIGWDRVLLPEVSDGLVEHAIEVNGEKELPPKDFKTDGCTLWPDSLLDYSWQDECIEHDIRYWAGGTDEERLEADLKLRDDVNKVLPGMGDMVYLGVRVGGKNLVPWPWGWGYGWSNGGSTTIDVIIDKIKNHEDFEI